MIKLHKWQRILALIVVFAITTLDRSPRETPNKRVSKGGGRIGGDRG